jgi:thioredoxin reductase (NADPH)
MGNGVTDLVIIGGGPVGLFAVFQAGMLGMKTHLFDSLPTLGGQCSSLYPQKPIYDIPGHPKILAKDLIENLLEQAKPFNPVYHTNDQVIGISRCENQLWKVCSKKGFEIYTKAIVIAAGNGSIGPNRPIIQGLEKFEERGSVLYHLDDFNQLRGQIVAIAGGGDSAADWTNLLGHVAKKVYLIHRRENFNCMPCSLEKIKKLCLEGAAAILAPMQVVGIKESNEILTGAILQNSKGEEQILQVDKILFCYGLKMHLGPILEWNIELVRNQSKIKVDPLTYQTNLSGVYAVGDVAFYEGKLKLILTGFAEVASALHNAHRYVFPDKVLRFQYSTDVGVPH